MSVREDAAVGAARKLQVTGGQRDLLWRAERAQVGMRGLQAHWPAENTGEAGSEHGTGRFDDDVVAAEELDKVELPPRRQIPQAHANLRSRDQKSAVRPNRQTPLQNLGVPQAAGQCAVFAARRYFPRHELIPLEASDQHAIVRTEAQLIDAQRAPGHAEELLACERIP